MDHEVERAALGRRRQRHADRRVARRRQRAAGGLDLCVCGGGVRVCRFVRGSCGQGAGCRDTSRSMRAPLPPQQVAWHALAPQLHRHAHACGRGRPLGFGTPSLSFGFTEHPRAPAPRSSCPDRTQTRPPASPARRWRRKKRRRRSTAATAPPPRRRGCSGRAARGRRGAAASRRALTGRGARGRPPGLRGRGFSLRIGRLAVVAVWIGGCVSERRECGLASPW